jgi:hypothetical protein
MKKPSSSRRHVRSEAAVTTQHEAAHAPKKVSIHKLSMQASQQQSFAAGWHMPALHLPSAALVCAWPAACRGGWRPHISARDQTEPPGMQSRSSCSDVDVMLPCLNFGHLALQQALQGGAGWGRAVVWARAPQRECSVWDVCCAECAVCGEGAHPPQPPRARLPQASRPCASTDTPRTPVPHHPPPPARSG